MNCQSIGCTSQSQRVVVIEYRRLRLALDFCEFCYQLQLHNRPPVPEHLQATQDYPVR